MKPPRTERMTIDPIVTKETRRMTSLPRLSISAALFVAGLALAGLGAAPATAATTPGTGWAAFSSVYPTNLAPGASGAIQIGLLNTGAKPSEGPITVTDTLPPGVSATQAGGIIFSTEPLTPEEEESEFGGARWICTGNGTGERNIEGATVITCTSNPEFLPHLPDESENAVFFQTPPVERLGIKVTVDPGATEREHLDCEAEPTLCNRVTVGGGGAAGVSRSADSLTVSSSEPGLGFSGWNVWLTNADGTPATQAGSHPYQATFFFGLNERRDELPGANTRMAGGELRSLDAELPPGFLGDPRAVPRCTRAQLNSGFGVDGCPASTQVGLDMVFRGIESGGPGSPFPIAVYNMVPPPGEAAEFALSIAGFHAFFDFRVNSSTGGYRLVEHTDTLPRLSVDENLLTLWGVPADPIHNFQRAPFGVCEEANGCPSGALLKPLVTLPTSCVGPQPYTIHGLATWTDPNANVEATVLNHDNEGNLAGFDGCERLAFNPAIESDATTAQGESGSGLNFNVDFHDEGIGRANGLAESQVKKAVVTLPEGVTINPSVGEGLGVCTPADLERETVDSPLGAGCPGASKLGTLHATSPLVDEALDGSIFLAQQDDPATTTPGAENPFDSLIALYLVLKNPQLGVSVHEPLKIEPDPKTGQLVATLEDNAQIPISHFNLHFREGQRAPLITPAACGTYTTRAKLYPWADPENPQTVAASFKITRGVGGGPCPSGGVPPFHPGFEAGAINNNAGSFSPFAMRLIRSDGEQDMTKFSAILPPGELGSLAGVSKCADSAIDVAKAKTGRQEIASPSCPANSLIGHTLAGAGVGESLTFVGGQIYLGGPFHGDPLSVISITPAVAGPFDAGTVVVQLALTLNPKTAEVEVDGAASDPIPHILKGIVLKLRDLRVFVDRPNFTLNPTSCDESKTRATLFGAYLDVFNPADDVPAALQARYQAASCASLGYKPGLDLQLKGGTKRGGHPGLLATYKPRKGDANTKGLVVRLPRSAFLDQAHIRTICTRVQFAAKSCPPGAQYGFIKAWTPLLDTPLEGPVWLRSSNHKLPDLVFDLHGLVDIEVSTRIDSAKGGIRASLENLPDAPLSKVLLQMQGGKKGLIVNSRNLCGSTSKANVEYVGQNGKEAKANPVMRADCGGKRGRKRHRG